jgi:hypothetical protein
LEWGKVGGDRRVNKEAFQTVLSRIWRTVGTVVFKEVQDNIWLFEFSDNDDKLRILDGRPWSYDRQIIVLNEFDGCVPPSQMEFSHSPFWVQVHDMPLICMNRTVGSMIGESLGEVVDVDVAGDGSGWGRCLRIRVRINLQEPLERGRALHLGGKSYWVNFRYEKLPMFCFHCGRVLHGPTGCPVKGKSRRFAEEETKEWGVWLRAADFRRSVGGERGGRFSTTAERGSGVRDTSGGWGTAEPTFTRGTHGWGCSDEHDVGSKGSASTNRGERQGVGLNPLTVTNVVSYKTTPRQTGVSGGDSGAACHVDPQVSPFATEKSTNHASPDFVEKVGQLGTERLKDPVVAPRGVFKLVHVMEHEYSGVGTENRGSAGHCDVGEVQTVGEMLGHGAVTSHVVSHMLDVRGDVRPVQGVMGEQVHAGIMDVGQGMGCTYVAATVSEGANGSGEGRGAAVEHLNAASGHSSARASLVQAGSGVMEVEQQGPVGRKSLRQWKRKARVSKVVPGQHCKPLKVLGKRQDATRLVGEGGLVKKKKNAEECVVVQATKTGLAGSAMQPCPPK